MSHSQTENPFAATTPEMPSATLPLSIVPPASRTFRQKLIRHASSTVVVGAFFAIGYFAIRQWLEGQWLVAIFGAVVSLMCIPLVDHSSSIRKRLIASCLMPLPMVGLATFIFIYFQLFRIPWFERLFNDKGSGPVGLILFALPGFGAGCYLSWFILNFLCREESGDDHSPGIANSE